jgi:hypothetical protein
LTLLVPLPGSTIAIEVEAGREADDPALSVTTMLEPVVNHLLPQVHGLRDTSNPDLARRRHPYVLLRYYL